MLRRRLARGERFSERASRAASLRVAAHVVEREAEASTAAIDRDERAATDDAADARPGAFAESATASASAASGLTPGR